MARSVGTVLFFRHRGFFPSLIRVWTQSTWDHVAIITYSDSLQRMILEAVPGGARLRSIKPSEGYWWTIPEHMLDASPAEIGKLVDYAYAHTGVPYDWANDLRAAFDLPRARTRRRQCVELVVGALRAAGLVVPSGILTPEHLADYLCGKVGSCMCCRLEQTP